MNKYRLFMFLMIQGIILKGIGQAETPVFSFGVIADVQYCDCVVKGTRFYRNSPVKLDSALEMMSTQNLSFLVHLGDVIDRDYRSFDTVLPQFNELSIPTYFVLGNHEFSVSEAEKKLVPEKLGLEKRYYDFAVAGWRFVVTDGNDESAYAWPEGSKGRKTGEKKLAEMKASGKPNAEPWNGGIGKKQMKWLEKTLADAALKKEHIVLFSHFPVYPSNEHNLWNDREIKQLLESSPGVVAWMSGHNHAGGYTISEKIHYLIFHGMVETENTTAWAIVEVYKNRLVVKGEGREPYRVLKF
ncbi:MAG: metallophosphoesterase [Bacteroidia bacterium]